MISKHVPIPYTGRIALILIIIVPVVQILKISQDISSNHIQTVFRDDRITTALLIIKENR